MWPFILFLAVFCAVLAYLLVNEFKKRSNLLEEYCEIKARQDLAAEAEFKHPEIKELCRLLEESGAEGARMSGSGPTIVAYYKEDKKAAAGMELLSGLIKEDPSVRAWLTDTGR